ncbi:MAG: hypothetical protein ACYDHU_11700 [Acidimicrobiales bacterium]
MADAELVLTGEEWVAAMNANMRPPTPTDVTITWDGRAINTKEKLLAVLAEIDANQEAGITGEELERRAGTPWWTHIDWDWDPVGDPRS